MPVSIVVGGQFGSEGKGKVALEIAKQKSATYVVRVGGTNSGHTALDNLGRVRALRQLPAAVLAPSCKCILPPGAIIDPEILLHEISELEITKDRIVVSPYATLISEKDKVSEEEYDLPARIGSTGSGTGAALIRRMQRLQSNSVLAGDHPQLRPFLGNTSCTMRDALKKGEWIIIEGTQGFGLSLLHGGSYPHATSRDTTAGAFLAEAGLSPLDVGDVTLVIRAHPIRVAGNSGPLQGETSWAAVAKNAGLPPDYCERTTATRRIRRVGTFDPEIVRRAIEVNNPSTIVLNHFDYVDCGVRDGVFSPRALRFLTWVESAIGRRADWVGIGPHPEGLIRRDLVIDNHTSSCGEMKIPA